jgi:hypothetical protein
MPSWSSKRLRCSKADTHYTYGDADQAIGQPKLGPVTLFGFSYNI